MSEGNCCNKCQSILIIVLLALNTFFVGSIWCSLSRACHQAGVKGMCPLTGKVMGQSSEMKMCPINGHMMDKASEGLEVPAAK